MSVLVEIYGTKQANRSADVVFIHGLGGDSHGTWEVRGHPDQFWPKWLGEDLPSVGIWSLDYESSPSFAGHSMTIYDRALNAIAHLDAQGLGKNPTILICHSLGGLLAKQIIRQCVDSPGNFERLFLKNLKGIVFFATPHSGSSAATWATRLLSMFSGQLLSELTLDNPQLRDLNNWYRANVGELGIKNQAYAETQKLGGTLIVDAASADPGIPNLIPIPVDANHISICKIPDRENFLYLRIRAFVVHVAQPAPDNTVSKYPERIDEQHKPVTQVEAAIVRQLPEEYGTKPAEEAVSILPAAALRRILDKRLVREDVAIIFFETFGEDIDDRFPGKSKSECIAKMIVLAEKRNREPQLYEAIAGQLPDVNIWSFAQFVPKEIVQRVIDNSISSELGGGREEITVVFTDVRHFTAIAEAADPDMLMHQTSRYFSVLTEAFLAQGGTVDKFIGDAVMVFWNAPNPQPDHIERACRAVLAGRMACEKLNAQFEAEGLKPFFTRFSIHVGEAVVGNLGSTERMNYTALGNTVNLAARLQGLNKRFGTTILVSEGVYSRVRHCFQFRAVDSVIATGMTKEMRIFELVGAAT